MALSGNFFTTYYNTRRYEFLWNATQSGNRSTVNWELYVRDETDRYITLWSLFLDLTVTKGTLASTSTTVVADKLGSQGQAGGQQYFSNNGQGKTSATTAELYHLDYVYSTSKNRLPYTGCCLARGTFVIDHTASGDGAFSVNLKTATYGNTTYQTGFGSYTLDATAIKSTISVSGTPKMGEKPSFTINRVTATITHNLRYELKNKSGQVVKSGSIANGVSTSYNEWTIPKDLATEITDSDYGTMVVYCKSINGANTVGETSCTWQCYVSDDTVPSVSVALSDASGYLGKVGHYLQNYSKVKVTATASGKYGSTIKQISTTANGKTYNGSPVTLDAFATSKSYEIVTTVTDTRGRTASAKATVAITAYSIPTMTLSAYRCKSQTDSTRDDSGEWAKITVTGNVAAVNGRNTGSLSLDATGYSEGFTGLSGAFTKSVIVAASTSIAIPISAELTDTIGAVPSRLSISLQAGFAIMEVYKDGHGVSFGEECAGHGFYVGMDAVLRKTVTLEQQPTASGHATNKAYVDGSTAPAGFGLGKDINDLPTANDANNCVKNGWYKLIIGTANGIESQGIMRVDAEGGANIVQTAYAGYATSKGMVIMQRAKFQGTWGEWEYVTPLCVPGIEYRTTERMGGSPVYCKVISFGTLPNNTFKNVAHGITGKTQNVRYEISTLSTNRMFTHYPGITDVVVDGTNVKITTNQNLSDISVTFVLWYIK